MTSYTVLKKISGEWAETAEVEASSSRSAISKIVSADKNGAGEYVAVPSRSFNPVRVQFETKVKFG